MRRLLAMGVFAEEDIRGDGPLGSDAERLRLVNAAHIARNNPDEFDEWQLNHILSQPCWPGGCLVREVFGNPFRPVTLDPGWLSLNVVAIAQGIYDDRAFDHMPILADALQEAGCEVPDILDHCRNGGEHVRGCWVVDLVLGKE